MDKKCVIDNEQGSVILLAMLILIVLTILGIASLNTSTIEFQIVGNEKIYQRNFNIAESGDKKEAYYVGHSSKDWYTLKNPLNFNHFLNPSDAADYDPGNDTGKGTADFDKSDAATWPSENLLNDTADNKYDYVYLTTYLNPDDPPKGYDAGSFSGYKFRMNSQNFSKPSKGVSAIEIAGIKVGVKVSSF